MLEHWPKPRANSAYIATKYTISRKNYLNSYYKMKLKSITKANDGKHKLKAVFIKPGGKTKTTRFGAVGYSDFTQHHDEERKTRYIKRHRARENFNDPTTAGSLSRYILWNKKTIGASISDFKNKFNL